MFLPEEGFTVNHWRFWRLYFSLLGMVVHIFVYDVLLGRWFRASTIPRWVGLARRFRRLAIALGGVSIKLGQFLSVRVDVLPAPVTHVLADLRDQVPPIDFDQIIPMFAMAWGQAYDHVMVDFDTTAVAAASLGQVYKARRRDDQRVVAIKVLRPGIHAVIETDLAAVQAIVRLIKNYPLIQQRADLQRIFDEFALVLRQELDYRIEANNNATLGRFLNQIPRVALPTIHHDLSNRDVLVMDWVDGISPEYGDALTAAGIDRSAVATQLIDIFFTQCFVHGTFHADPHPGNLLIVPKGNGDWTLTLLDLGAVAHVPATLQKHLRAGVIAMVGNDVPRLIQAFDDLGMILPEADRDDIQRVLRRVLADVFDRSIADLRTIDVKSIAYDTREVMLTLPFQLPQDVVYLGRTLGLLSGVVTMLDPEINFFRAAQPLAQRWLQDGQDSFIDGAIKLGRQLIGLPQRLNGVLNQLEQGQLRVDMRRIERQLQRMEATQRRRDLVIVLLLGVVGYMLWR